LSESGRCEQVAATVATHLIASGAGGALNDWANPAVDGAYAYFGLQAPGAGANMTTQLWRSDGTAGGTQLVETFADNSAAGVIGTEEDRAGVLGVTTLANGKLAISTFDGVQYQVYLSDGTAVGTTAVTGYTGDLGAYLGPDGTSEVGGTLVFQSVDPLAPTDQLNPDEVWSLNEATRVATELASGSIGNWSINQALMGGKVYYTLQVEGAADADATQLWATDGTPAGTQLAVTLSAETTDHVQAGIQWMMPTAGNQLVADFFNGSTDLVGTMDGTQEGTSLMPGYPGGFAGFGAGLSAEIGDSIPCFCPGTLIRTPDGERAVETLRVGDLTRTAAGELKPIVWIGSGRVLLRRGRRCAATPVIVRRGALGPNGTVKLGGLRLGRAGVVGYLRRMTTPRDPLYSGYRYPAELIGYAVWLYFRFPLSLRMVEEMLAARGISVTYETIRQWGLKFGREFANRIRRRTPGRGDKWHLDEVVITIAGEKHWLWRAVDQEGFVLDVLVQSRRDKNAAKRLLRKLLKKQGRAPRVLITDKLRSYAAAKREIMPGVEHRQHKGLNNRAENSVCLPQCCDFIR
jgi:putative transposase